MTKVRRLTNVLLILFLCLPLAGCWDALPLEQRDIALGIGVDLVEGATGDEPRYEFTFATPLFERDRTYPSQIRTVRAHTMDEAIGVIHHAGPRTLFFGKLSVVLFGRAAAEDGVAPHLNELFSYPELRVNAYVLVAEHTAKEVLLVVPPSGQRVATQLGQMIRRANRQRDTPPTTLNEFATRMLCPGFDVSSGLITPIGSLDPRPSAQKGSAGGGGAPGESGAGGKSGGGTQELQDMQVNKIAFWRGDKMLTEMSLQDTQFLTVANGTANGLLVTLLLPLDERFVPYDPRLVVRVLTADPKWSVSLDQGTPHFELEQGIYLIVENYAGRVDITEQDNADQLIALLEDVFAQNILFALQQPSKYGCDPLGLGQQVRRRFPEQWAPEAWPETLKSAAFSVRARVRVRNFGTGTTGMHPK